MTDLDKSETEKPKRPQNPKKSSHIQSIKPERGPAGGGTEVEIQAKMNLVGVEYVWFGDKMAEKFKATPPLSLKVTSPKSPSGKVKITVKTAHGDFELGEFTYE
jgi:hypothetical protein